MQDNDLIERHLDRQRARMAAAVAELGRRSTIRHVAGAALRGATPLLAGAAPMVARFALRRPVGSSMLSAGLAYLIFGHEPDLRITARKAARVIDDQGRALGQASSGALAKVQTAVDKVQSALVRTGSVAQDGLHNLGRALPSTGALRAAAAAPLHNPRPLETGALAFGAAFALGLVLLPRARKAKGGRAALRTA